MNLDPLTPHSIRGVQFREKLRGYHPEDVDAFVAAVAKGFDDLLQRVEAAEARARELDARGPRMGEGSSETEEALRRTLVLAQRTADLAIQEARDEAAKMREDAARERASVESEVAESRDRLRADAEAEVALVRERLGAERVALQTDVAALEEHLTRERERLRIYFTDQLDRVERGEPGVRPAPELVGPADIGGRDDAEDPDDVVDAGTEADRTDDADDATETVDVLAAEEDPFLAELRRAVTDDKPLGPRDDEPKASVVDQEADLESFDLFAKGEEDTGRFGFRRRR
jgi:cell division initiation protein